MDLQSATFHQPDPARYNRVIVGMEFDRDGLICSVSAFDAEAAGLPDPDNGPCAAGIQGVGRWVPNTNQPAVELFEQPAVPGTVDGFKTESLAVREAGAAKQIFLLPTTRITGA